MAARLQSRLAWLIFLRLALFVDFTKGNLGHAVYCVDRQGSSSSDCLRVNGCCNSLSLLLTEFYARYENASNLEPRQIAVEIHSDLNLNETVHIENMSSVEIKGVNNSSIMCLENNGEMNAGLYFKDVSNIVMSNLSFLKCGSLQESTSWHNKSTPGDFDYFHASLYLLHCTNVTLVNISIMHGQGIGAALFNVLGSVNISHCLFEDNRVCHVKDLKHSGGGGLYIELTNHPPENFGEHWTKDTIRYENSNYTIQNCFFLNNTANTSKNSFHLDTKEPFQGFGRGGGLALYLNGDTKQCSIIIESCHFQSNSAVVGGGMFIMFRQCPSYNTIIVKDTDFSKNTGLFNSDKFSRSGAGGGVGGGFLFSKHDPVNNSLIFINCTFRGNIAGGSGGGLSLFATKGMTYVNITKNTIRLNKCKLSNNSAYVASALDFAPEIHDRLGSGVLPIPVVQDCSFIGNYVRDQHLHDSSHRVYKTSLNGIITVFISSFEVEFRGEILFKDNRETALHLSSASVHLASASSVCFIANHAKYGGAVTMLAFSVIYVQDNCHLQFINNTAQAKGGAFYVSSSDHQHETHYSLSCFMQYKGNNSKSDRNITFFFQNNSALSGIGHLLYATSLLPCTYDNQGRQYVFGNIGNVTPQANSLGGLDITTLTYDFMLNETTVDKMQSIIPGIDFNMNITSLDELRQGQMEGFYAYMAPNTNISIDKAYTQVSNNIIKVYGSDSGTLILESHSASISVDIRLGKCPPGFRNSGRSCVCSPSAFLGVSRCVNSSVYIFRGFWIGLYRNESICSAHCPAGYCFNNHNNSEEFLLPPDIDEIDHVICGPYRTGTLCGQCVNGSSVQYHSHAYTCKPNKYCKIGIIFYFLSELVPLIIFFSVVTMFNISFSSGALNGFIFFAQMSDTIDMSAGGTIGFPEPVEIATYPYKLIYRAFNFDFFSLDELLFCLWESATTMDALSMKFLTITFALLLIILIIFVFNTWKFKLLCHWIRPRTLKAAFTHGLSTLLIVSFSQCARVSFLILSPTLLSIGTGGRIPVVFFSGNLEPFVGKHLKYALPALLFLLLLVILPLLWLLSYPLLFKILGICHLSETKFSACLSRLFPIELLDFFQSCFKENHRYFAGLYLLYRFVPLVIFANVHRLLQFHAMLSVQFLIMFTLHSVIQPYKSQWHNRLDSFILANISLVNSLTTYNYAVLSTGDQLVYKYTVHWIICFQILLMYCPLFYLLYYSVTEIYFRVKMPCKGYFRVSSEDSDLLPPLRDF